VTCGTRAGYQLHQADDTRPCPGCLAANVSAVKASRVRTGKTRSLNVPVDVLRQTLEAHDCKALLEFLGEQVADAVTNAPKARSESTP
jgi:hypothetical protein